ncbi:YdcF family protein [Derxia gummosa]|uniref:YdcF family protein n=1 Tax=Derxia gummosa DSM 723 TaxID=1121388 RepID=A0A8B6XAE7_9BURK|nr:YdcF family protein [Derxia gummosa]
MVPDWLASGWFWWSLISTLLLPPASLLIVMAIGLFSLNRRPNLGWLLIVASSTVLWLGSTSYIALTAQQVYTASVRGFDPATLPHFKSEYRPAMIVVLGGGRVQRPGAERGQIEDLAPSSAERLRQAVHLARQTRLPITVSGGMPDGGISSEAAIMARVLSDDFALPARYAEELSGDTRGNAAGTARMLIPAGIRNIVLVTDAVHMPRARAAFAAAGFTVYAAPVPQRLLRATDPRDWLPTAEGLATTRALLREMVAMAAYQMATTLHLD